MRRGTVADLAGSLKYISNPELADYRWHVLNVLSEKRLTSLYELLESVQLLSEDTREKQEYLEYLIQESRKEYVFIQKQLEKLKKEDE